MPSVLHLLGKPEPVPYSHVWNKNWNTTNHTNIIYAKWVEASIHTQVLMTISNLVDLLTKFSNLRLCLDA